MYEVDSLNSCKYTNSGDGSFRLQVGYLFQSKKHFCMVLKDFMIREEVEINRTKNYPGRF